MTVRRLIGYVPQQLSAEGALTGRENAMLFARLFDVPRAERAGRVDRALEATGMLEHADRMVSTYSGGMVRRLELAQALVNRPRLLILDEPTIGLDPIARGSVWDLIAELREQSGMTVLLTTHYMDEADGLCERVALMHRGRIRRSARRPSSRPRSGPTRRSTTSSATTPATCPTTKRGSAMSAVPAAPRSASADTLSPWAFARVLLARVGALCLVELQRLRHDRSELYTRAIQPALWLVIFGGTFNRLHAIPTGDLPYIDFLAPGHPGPVGALHLDLLRHPDHLGARRGDPREAARHADPARRADRRQGVRGRDPRVQPGHRRARPVGDPRRRAHDEPAAARSPPPRPSGSRPRSSRACRCRSPGSSSSASGCSASARRS